MMSGSSDSSQDNYKQAANLNLRIYIQEKFGTRNQTWFDWLFHRIRVFSPKRLLELGCGPGTLWFTNASRVPSTWRITLTDTSIGMMLEAKSTLKEFPFQVEYTAADASALPFRDETMELILANGVFDIVPDLQKSLAEADRVLVPFGHLIAATAGPQHLQELEQLIRLFEPGAWLGQTSPQFSSENGRARLSERFTVLAEETFEDELTFNNISPIIVYIRSETDLIRKLSREQYQGFIDRAQDEVNARGEIRVKVEKVVFIAEKPEGGLP